MRRLSALLLATPLLLSVGCKDDEKDAGPKADEADCKKLSEKMVSMALAEKGDSDEAKKQIEATLGPKVLEQCKKDPPAKAAVECVLKAKDSLEARRCDGAK